MTEGSSPGLFMNPWTPLAASTLPSWPPVRTDFEMSVADGLMPRWRLDTLGVGDYSRTLAKAYAMNMGWVRVVPFTATILD